LKDKKHTALEKAEKKVIAYLEQEYPKVSENVIKKLFEWSYAEKYLESSGISYVIELCETLLTIFSENDFRGLDL
jgi:hypothetical protein